jgi:hypothetical protein
VPDLPVERDHDDRKEPGCRELLAVQQLRRDLERFAHTRRASRGAPVAVKRQELVSELLEFIAALDRRVPRVERLGEATIAREAAALRARAVRRLRDLEAGADTRRPV